MKGLMLAALLGAALPTGGAVSVKVGDIAPDFEGTWINHPDTSLADLSGHLVFVDVWRTWCGPCTKQVPHLNSLWERYGPRGLIVVGVTNEGEAMVAPDVEKKKMKYPVAVLSGEDFDLQYGIESFPTGFLLGPDGEVLWRGHPASFDEKLLEEHLGSVWAPPAVAQKDIAKALAEKNLAKAWKALDKALASSKEAAELRAAKEAIEKRIGAQLEAARAAETSADFAAARRAYQDVIDRFGGVPEAEPAKAGLAALAKNKDAKVELEAADRFDDALSTWRKGDLEKGLKAIRNVAKKYAGTAAGKRAQALSDLHEEE